MKTLTLFVAYIVSATIIFVLPALMIALIFPCSYHDVVTCSVYVAIMAIMALVGAVPIAEELEEKLN
jgi:hypothetical protein